MFIAALFTIAKTWKQPKYPLTDEQIKKRCTHTQWNNSHKKNKIMPFVATQMQLEIIILNELSEKKRQILILYDITQMWNLKYGTNEPVYKTETDSQTQRSECCCQGERREIDWEFGVGICKLLHLE